MGKQPKRKLLDCSSSASTSAAAVIRSYRHKRMVSGTDASVLPIYYDCGDCDCVCAFCGTFFWYIEMIANLSLVDHPRALEEILPTISARYQGWQSEAIFGRV
ncbi:unnamed protein product [Lactuca virosa]|uniref:Uncharacterized protein n=1 Tax=Lactuca virosa TaxID=75947 RepID=A0AAU9PI31_9ASTR|nr:unnamed protein product [Lactuca virosa]